jgi:hypothetical protein
MVEIKIHFKTMRSLEITLWRYELRSVAELFIPYECKISLPRITDEV